MTCRSEHRGLHDLPVQRRRRVDATRLRGKHLVVGGDGLDGQEPGRQHVDVELELTKALDLNVDLERVVEVAKVNESLAVDLLIGFICLCCRPVASIATL